LIDNLFLTFEGKHALSKASIDSNIFVYILHTTILQSYTLMCIQ